MPEMDTKAESVSMNEPQQEGELEDALWALGSLPLNAFSCAEVSYGLTL